ncbi:MAG: PA2778 family cysteine peptidase [Gammaproteobacteria bacterium]
MSGCTAIALADRVIPKEPQDLPTDIRLDVPFIEQTDNLCGPSSLAMVANYYGQSVTAEDVSNLMYIPEKKGSLQIEMQAAARSLGLVAYSMNMDLASLRSEINAERPVIVLQNLAFNVYPIWHYSVVTGRDPNNDYFLLHSGRHKYYRSAWTTFENTWRRGKYWALIAAPIGDIPNSVTEKEAISAALDLEKVGKLRGAQLTYAAIIQRWPDNFTAQVGLANTHMQLQEPLAASEAYKQALLLNTQSAEALNNFAYSAFDLGCEITALEAASCAIRLDNANHPELSATLNELKSKSATPSNHASCPQIRCNNQSLAANNH